MGILLPIVFFAGLLLIISWAGYKYYVRPGRFYEQVGTATVETAMSGGGTGQPSALIRTIKTIGEQVPVSPQDVIMDRRYLIAAGYRNDSAVPVYYGIRVLVLAGFLLIAFIGGRYIEVAILGPVAYVVCGVAGFFLPGMVLDFLVESRREVLRLSLPDALDMMVVCVEAGLGLDQAIAKVSEELAITHPEICEEFNLVTLEMRAGKRRSESLRNLSDRTGEGELRKLVSILIQTDRFGTSIADSLRTHSDYMRVRRRQDAEERAGKVGVKLVFPIFFCILPAMLAVVGGPGILQILKQLVPLMKQFPTTQM